jgi:hypothetical protein
MGPQTSFPVDLFNKFDSLFGGFCRFIYSLFSKSFHMWLAIISSGKICKTPYDFDLKILELWLRVKVLSSVRYFMTLGFPSFW